ncbi:phage tail tape measure protein [Pantoea sp. FN060301]|uniref:phage tail tape measure protein n=1 Tax=Pantoea sp. FN060301 TaxID=3420380 RepID=UPI003D16FBAD
MAEQQSRLAIVLDSTGAQRNAEGLAGALHGLTDWGKKAAASAGQASKATEEEARALSTLLDRIDPVNAALNRLDEQQRQLAKFRAKGFIDTDTFDVYSKKVEEARTNLSGFNAGMDKGAVSAGQYKQAMRQLPAQFTDIFTSLAGGMPLWLVFTQQGGQIADSFGGWGSLLDVIKRELLGMSSANDEASESLSESANGLAENVEHGQKFIGFLTPARAAIAGTAATMAVLGLAYYKGAQEQDEFTKSLILTGNTINKTTGQLAEMSQQVAAMSGSTVSEAAVVINQLVSAGKVAGSSLSTAAQSILSINDATGIATKQLIADFNAIAEDPVSAIEKLNDKYHFLTLATYNQIKALQDEGRTTEAAKIATVTYSNELEQRSTQIKESLSSIQNAWDSVWSSAKGAWDAMRDTGRNQSPESQLATLEKSLDEAKRKQSEGGIWNRLAANTNGYNISEMEKQVAELKSQLTTQGILNGAISDYNNRQKDGIEAQQRINTLQEQSLSNTQKRSKAQQALTRDLEKARAAGQSITAAEEKQLRDNIDNKFKDPKTTKTKAYRDDAGQRLLLQLQQQQATLAQQESTGYKIGAQQQALIKWEQQLSDLKSKGTLTAEQKSLLANADILTKQYQQNAALERQIETAQKALAIDRARADITRTIANRQSQYATDELFAGGGLSQYDQQQYTQRLSLEQSYNDKISQLRQQRASASSDIAREEIDQEIQLQRQALSTELNNYDEHMQRMNQSRRSFSAGASRAWQEYQDSAANVSAMSQQLFSNAFGGMEDSLVNFVTTGKASFKDFTTSIISDLARIAARQALVGIGSSIFGSVFSAGASAAGGASASSAGSSGGMGMSTNFHAYAKGGVPGGNTISAYRNGVYDSPQYFAFAKGAGVFGEAGPEAIMPLARGSDGSLGVRMVNGGGGVAGITVNAPVSIIQQQGGNNTETSNTNTANTAKQLEGIIKTTLNGELKKQMSPGGLLYR